MAAKPASAYSTIKDHGEFLGHPKGLFVLFFTEMWERFSFYGMRALLVLYMTQHLINGIRSGTYVFGFEQVESFLAIFYGQLDVQPLSSQIYGLYTAFVYLTPLFGGLLADKLLGQRKTVFLGGILMAVGHFLMAIESMFLLALVFLILGNGCFKPNISTQVGSLYPPGDPRRDGAFTIFYMGVNLGAFLSPFVCGTLGQLYGWHYGFGAAGIGMMVGLVVYVWGQKYLAQDQLSRDKEAHVDHPKLTGQEWNAIIALITLCMLNVVFWAVYEQQGNTIQLFADSNVDWTIFGWQMPSTWFQALNPLFIVVFAPFLTMFWRWQSKHGHEPGSVIKMSIGVFLLGASFLVLMFATKGLAADGRINFLWLVGCTLIYTFGELYLSPIGLSLVTKVAPVRYVGMMMGMWFLSSFFGNYLSGYIGMFYSSMTREQFFLLLVVLGIADAIAIFAFSRPLKRAFGSNV